MMEFIRDYQSKPWPKLEIPPLRQRQVIGLVLFMILFIALGWAIYLNPETRVKYFAMMGLVVPIVFLLKSRHTALIGLLSLQVILAFVFMGNQNYVLLGVAGLAGAIIAFESPILIYAVLIFWIWFEMSSISGLVSHPLRLEFVIGLGFFAGWFVKERILSLTRPAAIIFPEKWPAILFMIWALLGFAFWAIEPIPAGWFQIRFIMIGILFLLISPLVLRTPRFLNVATWSWIGAGFVGAVAAFVTQITGYSPQVQASASWGANTGAMGIQHSWSASFLSFAFFVMLPVYYLMKRQLLKGLMLFSLLLTFGAILLQQSKGPTVGLFAGTGLFLLLEAFFDPKVSRLRVVGRIMIMVFFVTGLLLSIYYLGLGTQIGDYSSLFENPAGSSGMEARYILWATAYDMFSHEGHPLRGLGVGSFWALAYDYGLNYPNTFEAMDYQEQGINPHNLYIDTILHYGIIGFALFLWMAAGNLLRLRRGFKQLQNRKYRYLSLGVFCGLAAFYFSCLFDFTVFIVSRYWLFLGYSVVIINIASGVGPKEDVY